MDERLTPLERNAWQIIRMRVGPDGVTAFPTYDSLRPYLTSVPCSGRASDETIARALTLLRLTRWLSVVRHRRRAADGRILGNLYALHDEPLAPNEAIQLDPHYLSLVSDALTHASKAVQRVGFHTLQELASDPMLSGRALPSRLLILTQRMASHGWKLGDAEEAVETEEERLSSASSVTRRPGHSPNAPGATRSMAGLSPSSESEGRRSSHLRNPKQETVRTVRTDSINKEDVVSTVRRPREEPVTTEAVARWLERLPPEQRSGALATLQQLPQPMRQAVLEEWAARCETATVRHPARYLFGLIQRALRGEFNARGYAASQGRSSIAATHTLAGDPREIETAHDHIETLRQLLRIR
ncbi:MAG: hypothetical protein JSR66_09815 [Proteobacteria bacterium]|nr:hypothetical protein [Pseudomonadota bacterium]